MAAPRLTDGTIVLNGHTLVDVEAHLAGEDEEQARRFGWYPARSTPESVRQAIERWQAEWESDGARRTFAVREARTGSLAGGCELRLQDDQIAEMSYWTFAAFRDRGFASHAVELLCRWAFAELAVERIELYVEPDNAASRAVALRAGFTEEGTLRQRERLGEERRDMVLYSRLPSDRGDASIEES